ncbi:MAG TPA: ABC transporter ATP-binding protein [Cellulomonas sp.]
MTSARLRAAGITVGYGGVAVIEGLDTEIPDGEITAILGPNACGKSTLLRALARLNRVDPGAVLLDGTDIRRLATRDVARRIGLLPQSSVVPPAITVRDLVARGRYPHQGPLRRWGVQDEAARSRAMADAGVDDLADRPVDELSGGQRQRAWIAMVLAQETGILLLDEPTTYLDVAHQVELLDLCLRFRRDRGTTIVAVLHDLNQAFRYADRVVMMKDGRVVAAGPPAQVADAELVRDVFGLPCLVIPDPVTGTPLVVPAAPDA